MDEPVDRPPLSSAPPDGAPAPPALQQQEREERLKQLARMGNLAAGLAHELRNPLSTLKLNLQLLEEELAALPGETGKRSSIRLATLKKEADRLRQTLDDFLRFAGRIELRPQVVSLNGVVEELIDFLLPQAQAMHVRVHTALASDDPQCPLDVNLFKQALLNLLLNALQAMPAEETPASPHAKNPPWTAGRPRELLVRTLHTADQAILYVSDTGMGIPPQNLARIFEGYFTTKRGGTGLGLPTTRRIIEEHGGHITVESEQGKGTTFRVDLPLAR